MCGQLSGGRERGFLERAEDEMIVAAHSEVDQDHAAAVRKMVDWISNNKDLTTGDIFSVTDVMAWDAADRTNYWTITVWYYVTHTYPVPA
jgi:hypothetical protein